jgi:hypothetical protein
MATWNWLYIAAFFQILAFIIAFTLAVHNFFKKTNISEALESASMDRVEERLERIEKQFGPNGGGLRQAVNELTVKLGRIEERQIDISGKVAQLDGKFEQHIVENNN